MSTDSEKKISEKEKEIYDRQIRVWGFKAQQRIRNASVLLIGANALSGETAKNIVLAGVGELNILESENRLVTQNDINSIFFLEQKDLGKKILGAVKTYLAELNPNVLVNTIEADLTATDSRLLKKQSAVCSCEATLAAQLFADRICRANNVCYLSGDVFGDSGVCFSDFGESFVYSEKGKQSELRFSSLEDTLAFTETAPRRTLKNAMRREKLYFRLIKLLYQFEHKNSRWPTPSDSPEIERDLYSGSAQSEFEFPAGELKFLFDVSEFFVSLQRNSPNVAAILGGVLAQEILKAAAGNARPLQNWLFFGPLVGNSAVVLNL
ncbi:E1 ubiquitin-activating protein aos1 [Bonamia ostreae]|uniref:Ubiquitin-like 1-activating enzyme E1A n=1 Tax=Bonamia ostreae TaxID=126728 RepID=A0ABV2AF78_9EUKA